MNKPHHTFIPGIALLVALLAPPAGLVAQEAATEPAAPPAAVAPAAPEPAAPPVVSSVPDVPPATEAPSAPTPPAPPAIVVVEPEKRIDRRELVVIGSSSHLRAGETASEMVTIFGNALVDGDIRGESVTILGSVTINGRVGGELVCILGTITLGPNAEINGEVVSVGGTINAAPTAIIRGEKVQIGFPGSANMPSFEWLGQWFTEGLMLGRPLPHTRGWAWVVAGILLLLNVVFFAVFRRPVEATATALERKPAMSLVNGILAFVLFGPLVILLVASVVGILIVPFLMAGMFLAAFGGYIAIYRYCGSQLGLREMPLAALIVGNVLFTLIYAVPFIGFAVLSLAGLVGIGAAITAMIDSLRSEARPAKPGPGSPPAGSTFQPVAPAPGAVAAAAGVPLASMETPIVDAPASGAASAVAAGSVPLLTAAAVTTVRVGFWPRLGATALDFLLVGGLTSFLGLQFLFPYAWLAYHIAFWSWRATTIGGIVLNLRIERLDGRGVDLGVATVRSLGSIFSGMVLGIGFMWASWDEERQSWHDKIAGTTIVRVPRGQPLF